MPDLSFPLRHVSIRVPWHDAQWNGCVCKKPKFNTACLKLPSISDNKVEEAEERIAGHSLQQLATDDFPPCVSERATFMADFEFERPRSHPYTHTSDAHRHFRPTSLRYPPFSAAAIPFRWMMLREMFGDSKRNTPGLVDRFPLDEVNQDYEPELSFKPIWLQDHRNHRAVLECFWNHVRSEESLVFFYAKQVPLAEDTGRRVLVGVGRVRRIGSLLEYSYDGSTDGKLRSLIWERMITHSIRPDF